MAISNPTESFLPSSTGAEEFTLLNDHSIFTILRKNIYSNTKLAGIRELSTNAVDACIEADMPVNWSVHVPTLEEPYFSVRDYGPGMTKDFLDNDFKVVGASTKRNSNKTNGQFGMGRISPLAYTDSFTVESWNNGTHYSYLVSITDGKPAVLQLSAIPSSEPTGCNFTYQVKPDDIRSFHTLAANLYKYFTHKPNHINIELPVVDIKLDSDTFMLTDDSSGVVMANVYYPLDAYQIRTSYRGLVLKVPTGSVALTPGREALNYDDSTVKYLKTFVEECEKEIIDISNTEIQSKPTLWEQYTTYRSIYSITPYNLQDKLQPPTAFGLNSKNEYEPFIFPNADIMLLSPNYDKAMRTNRFYSSAFSFLWNPSTCNILLADTRFITHIYQHFTRLLIIKPHKDEFNNVQATLDNLGVPYQLSSSFPVPEREKTVRAPSTLRLYNLSGSLAGNYDPDKVGTIYYLPLDNGQLPEGIDISSLEYLQNYLKTPRIYGIAKGNLSKIALDTNFVLFTDYLQEQFENASLIIHQRPPHVKAAYYGSHADDFLASNKNPFTEIRNAYEENKHLMKTSLPENIDLSWLSTYVNFKTIPYTPSMDLASLKHDFPLLDNYWGSRPKDLEHYMKLEHFYHEHSLHSSG